MFEIASVKVQYDFCVFTELSEIIDIFENEALVKPCNVFIEEKLFHVRSDVVSLQSGFLDEASYFDVVVGGDAVVNDEQPHAHVLERGYLAAREVQMIMLLNELVEKLSAVPHCFCEVAAKRL